jgi:hypothetical protein
MELIKRQALLFYNKNPEESNLLEFTEHDCSNYHLCLFLGTSYILNRLTPFPSPLVERGKTNEEESETHPFVPSLEREEQDK